MTVNNKTNVFRVSTGRALLVAAAVLPVLSLVSARGQSFASDWKSNAISPVANPIYFEDPRITTEARPIFLEHRFPETYAFNGGTAPLGGGAQVYALQLRYALTDRLGLIATKDGYIASNPVHTVPHTYGWANVAAGLKYALVDDKADALIVTPGTSTFKDRHQLLPSEYQTSQVK